MGQKIRMGWIARTGRKNPSLSKHESCGSRGAPRDPESAHQAVVRVLWHVQVR